MALPAIVPFGGVWADYIEIIYQVYVESVANAGLTFNGLRVTCQYRPESQGKHFGFWHVISEGKDEAERLPDFRRCERITWIAYLIANVSNDADISWWENKRGTNTHVVIWHEPENFVVILAARNGYYMLRSAYCPESRRARTFMKERESFWKHKG
jgi:hypothetical protein